jgi:hypothetical protein
MRSIVGMALNRRALDREMCARSHVTALKSYGASELAMVARAMWTSRADKACTRSCPLGSSTVRSIAPSVLNHTGRGQDSIFAQIHPFEPQFEPRTYSTVKH